MADLNRRLLLGNDIVYPITKQENVINLQKTIKEKLPIVSSSQPTSGFVARQVWVDTGNGSQEQLSFENIINGGLTFGMPANEQLTFEEE